MDEPTLRRSAKKLADHLLEIRYARRERYAASRGGHCFEPLTAMLHDSLAYRALCKHLQVKALCFPPALPIASDVWHVIQTRP